MIFNGYNNYKIVNGCIIFLKFCKEWLKYQVNYMTEKIYLFIATMV